MTDSSNEQQGPKSRAFDLGQGLTIGASPGTLRIESEIPPKIHVMRFEGAEFEELEVPNVQGVVPFLEKGGITWVDVRGIGHAPTFQELGRIFHIHPLALEDMVNTPQRPKSEEFDDHHLIVTQMATVLNGTLHTEQFSVLFGKRFVLTVQEEPLIDCLDPVRFRIRHARGTVRQRGADYVAYALIDAVIDGYYPVLEHFGDKLDDLEERVLNERGNPASDIFEIKRNLLRLRRSIWPQRDVLAQLVREQCPHFDKSTLPYLRDTYDHTVQIMDMVESFRELGGSLLETLMTTASNRLNQVMKVLTIVSTIFLPMTFIAGVYGMNFDPESSPWNMPELRYRFGYPGSILLMILSAALLLGFYHHKGWLSSKDEPLLGPKGRRHRHKRKSSPRVD